MRTNLFVKSDSIAMKFDQKPFFFNSNASRHIGTIEEVVDTLVKKK